MSVTVNTIIPSHSFTCRCQLLSTQSFHHTHSPARVSYYQHNHSITLIHLQVSVTVNTKHNSINQYWLHCAMMKCSNMMVVWRSGSTLISINKVNLRRAQLVLGLVTMSGYNSQRGTFILVCNQLPRSTQRGHPFIGRCSEYQPKAVMPCGWGVKAGMVRVWLAGKNAWSSCYKQAISECFRDRA